MKRSDVDLLMEEPDHLTQQLRCMNVEEVVAEQS